jgi:hypothetical protein
MPVAKFLGSVVRTETILVTPFTFKISPAGVRGVESNFPEGVSANELLIKLEISFSSGFEILFHEFAL